MTIFWWLYRRSCCLQDGRKCRLNKKLRRRLSMRVPTIQHKRVRGRRSVFCNNKSSCHLRLLLFQLPHLFMPCFEIFLCQLVSSLLAMFFDSLLDSFHFSTSFLKPAISITCNIFCFCRCHLSFRKWLLNKVWVHLPVTHRRDVLKKGQKRVVISLENWINFMIMTSRTINSHCKKCFCCGGHDIVKLIITML